MGFESNMNGLTTPLAARGLKPVGELASSRQHGDRLQYMAGCRCPECRRANSTYENARQKARRNGDWNGVVPAAKARTHILKLSRLGVGRNAVAAASDVSRTAIVEIRAGKKQNIRARTERKILAVTKAMASDKALISAKEAWRLIDELLAAGFTKGAIALGIGRKTPALQLNREKITVRNAYLVAQLHARLCHETTQSDGYSIEVDRDGTTGLWRRSHRSRSWRP